MIVKKEVYFNASEDKIWDLLTNPEMTKQYMFGCEIISDWNVGSSMNWKGKTEDGSSIIHVKGEIFEFVAGKKVSFSTFDPNMGLKDIPKNYINLTYELRQENGGTLLTIIQGDFTGSEDAEKRFEESKQGWEMVIPIMKSLLEN